jgi:hypothetical protein
LSICLLSRLACFDSNNFPFLHLSNWTSNFKAWSFWAEIFFVFQNFNFKFFVMFTFMFYKQGLLQHLFFLKLFSFLSSALFLEQLFCFRMRSWLILPARLTICEHTLFLSFPISLKFLHVI